MTDPAQLKYLDAIGIPVWVSRDLVIGFDDLGTSHKNVVQKKTHDDFQKTLGHSQKIDNDCIGSADDIIQDLDQTPARQAPPQASREPITHSPDLLSVDKTPVPSEIGRTDYHTLYACGDLQADWMIIGESPELNEDRMSQPFAGESGILLNNMLQAVGLERPREQAYLINILRSSYSADDNNDLSKKLLNSFLTDKIKQIKPKIILLVGQLSAQNLLQTKEPLARLRTKSHLLSDMQIPVVVTYYPSYLISKPLDKRKAWDDLKMAMTTVMHPVIS